MDVENIPITVNCRVLVELVESSGRTERRELMLVTPREADFQSGLLDENTPLARTLLGHTAGESLPYGRGDLQEVRILSVERSEEAVSPEAARKRQAAVRKAAAQSEITNQMIFSTASGSKWGDYEVNIDDLLERDGPQDDD